MAYLSSDVPLLADALDKVLEYVYDMLEPGLRTLSIIVSTCVMLSVWQTLVRPGLWTDVYMLSIAAIQQEGAACYVGATRHIVRNARACQNLHLL